MRSPFRVASPSTYQTSFVGQKGPPEPSGQQPAWDRWHPLRGATDGWWRPDMWHSVPHLSTSGTCIGHREEPIPARLARQPQHLACWEMTASRENNCLWCSRQHLQPCQTGLRDPIYSFCGDRERPDRHCAYTTPTEWWDTTWSKTSCCSSSQAAEIGCTPGQGCAQQHCYCQKQP